MHILAACRGGGDPQEQQRICLAIVLLPDENIPLLTFATLPWGHYSGVYVTQFFLILKAFDPIFVQVDLTIPRGWSPGKAADVHNHVVSTFSVVVSHT